MFRLSPVSDVIQANGRKVAVCELTCPVGLLPVRIRLRPQININKNIMEKEIIVDEKYRTTKLFDMMKVGDIYKVPFDESRHTGIKSEAVRRNREARLVNKLKANMDLMFRVSKTEHPGYTSIIRLK